MRYLKKDILVRDYKDGNAKTRSKNFFYFVLAFAFFSFIFIIVALTMKDFELLPRLAFAGVPLMILIVLIFCSLKFRKLFKQCEKLEQEVLEYGRESWGEIIKIGYWSSAKDNPRGYSRYNIEYSFKNSMNMDEVRTAYIGNHTTFKAKTYLYNKKPFKVLYDEQKEIYLLLQTQTDKLDI